MAKNDPKVEQKAGLFLVDPNPPGRGVVPTEDMFIYVKFTATERNRGVKTISDTRDGEINFIATEVKYDSSGEPIKNLMGKTESYATTSYTDLGGFKNTHSSGSLEGFGIKNIDIKYNASLVPQVDISFTDVRGSALFDVIEQDNRKSPYSLFFKMPYPIFTLTVKGYFGNPVDYCLHMVNWNSKFDPSTGNFDIDANFLGFQQAFLADITIGNILGVNNTPEGKKALSELTITSDKGDSLPTPPLAEFIKKISKLQVDLEHLKASSELYKKLIVLNTQQQKLKTIQSFIGTPIRKSNGTPTPETPYEDLPNDNKIITSPIRDDLNLGKDYLSIRDYLIFKYSTLGSVNSYMSTYYDLLIDYQEFVVTNDSQLDSGIVDGIINNKTLNTDIFPITKGEEIDYLTGLEVDVATGIATTKDAAAGKPKYATKLSEALDELKRNFFNTDNSVVLTATTGPPSNPKNINGNFTPSEVKLINFIRPSAKGSGFFPEDPVFVLDFTHMRSEVNRMLIDIKKRLEEDKEEVNKEINETTVKTVFQIICNNAQALIQSIFNIAEQAEVKSNQRAKDLINSPVIDTDITSDTDNKYSWNNSTIYAFPKIIVESEDGKGQAEKYMGSKSLNLSTNSFPEIGFIENITEGITESSKELSDIRKQTSKLKNKGFDTDSWVPINPIDVTNDNPFFYFNSIESQGDIEIKKQFYNILLTRYAVAKNYSKMNPTQLAGFGMFDAINAKKSIFTPTIRKMLATDLSMKGSDAIISAGKADNYVIENNNIPILNENEELPKLGKVEVSGFRNNDIEYIWIDQDTTIAGSKTSLWGEIKKSDKYKSLFDKNFNNSKGKFTEFKNHLVLTNLCYGVWGDTVNEKLQKKVTNDGTSSFSIPENDITLIDGGTRPPGNETNTVLTLTKTDYINILKTGSASGAGQQVEISPLLTDSPLYSTQTDLSKALLLLNTLPFVPFDSIVFFDLTANGEYVDIIRLPKYYLLFIGGTLWRASQQTDPITWSGTGITSVTKNQYLYNIGDKKAYKGQPSISTSLTGLPTKTKEILIEYFTSWVNNYFYPFQTKIINYSKEDDIKKKYDWGLKLAGELSNSVDLVINAQDIFVDNGLNDGLKLTGFNNYYNNFLKNFTIEEVGVEEIDPAVIEKKNIQLEAIKLQIYNYVKNLYDKWVAGNDKNTLSYNACGTAGKNLIDYFKFIDRAFNDIGETAVVNLDSVANLSNNMDANLYFYISKILRDSNFLLQILPNYLNFKSSDEEEVKKIFTPVTNISERNRSSGPTYLCIYAGGTSEVLDLDEKSRYTYKQDGFAFDQPPPDFNIGKEDFLLVAFRVAYGAENQTMFKSVSLNQQEHRETGEYFAALTDLIDKKGGTQRSYQGTDLYRIFKTRSYKAEVEALGCMNIQPMMYFQLDNVPFFNGAYMILNVNHKITPNHMTTSFSGLRQSKILTTVVKDITTFLDTDFTDVLEGDPFVFSNLTNENPDRFNIGIDPNKDPDEIFGLIQIDDKSLQDMGVADINTLVSQNAGLGGILRTQFQNNQILSKSQVTMLLANMLTISKEFTKIVEEWPKVTSPSPSQQKYYAKDNPYGNPSLEDFQGNTFSAQTIAHKYRKRGYIPIIGLDEYKAATAALGVDLVTDPDQAFGVTSITPQGTNKELATKVSLFKWKKDSDKSAFASSDGGSANQFTRTVQILSGEEGNTLGKSFDNFARVLSRFDLLGINIDGKSNNKVGTGTVLSIK